MYTDAGYRFRMNQFNAADNWFPFIPASIHTFFDYKFYNSDTYDTGTTQGHLIAEMYFRIDTDKMEHSRQVYNLMDYLGDIGGIGDVL